MEAAGAVVFVTEETDGKAGLFTVSPQQKSCKTLWYMLIRSSL